jgi:hypothetical protein
MKRQRLVQVLAALVLASGLAIPLSIWFIWCDWVPDAALARLPSASRAEVRQLLGEPNSPLKNQEQAETWCYRRPWRWAEFQICFGPDGRVKDWYYDR